MSVSARPAADRVRLGRPHLAVERPSVDGRLGQRAGVELLDGLLAERAAKHALVADPSDDRARVHLLERDHALRAEPLCPGRARSAHDDALGLDALRLDPGRVDSVVADQGVAEAEHLRHVARVRDGLLVAGHRGGEAGLSRGDAGRAHRHAWIGGAVFEHEVGVTSVLHDKRVSA